MLRLLSLTLLMGLAVSISLAQDLKPTATKALLKVTVTDLEDKPRPNEMVSFEDLTSKQIYSAITDTNGRVDMLVPKGTKYMITQKTITETIEHGEMDIPNFNGNFVSNVTLRFQVTEEQKVYTLENVFFDSGKATLKPESYTALNNLLEILKVRKNMVIKVVGHTDNIGDDNTNLVLSQERAKSVKAYLIKNGIEPTRVESDGLGETMPVASNDTAEGKAKNRRTEIHILKND